VMMVTPVAKHPIAFRNSVGLRLISSLEFYCRELPTLPRRWGLPKASEIAVLNGLAAPHDTRKACTFHS
jgi:hypothetical protein